VSVLQLSPSGISAERVADEYSGSQRVQPVQRGHDSDNLRRRLSEALDSGQQPKHAADGERSHVPLSRYESELKAAGNTRDVADISDAERCPDTQRADAQ
jgi:hypothetical protein